MRYFLSLIHILQVFLIVLAVIFFLLSMLNALMWLGVAAAGIGAYFTSLNASVDVYKRQVGDSGAGKTTFIKVLLGLGKTDSGTVFVDGAAVSTKGNRMVDR